MKEITTHHDGLGLNELIRVVAMDDDLYGVPHRIEFYRRSDKDTENEKHPETLVGFLQFQKGPRNVEGSIPGLISDAVYASLIHILQGFQDGPYKSREGALVLTKLEEAALWSRARAMNRAARGVLGFNKAQATVN